MTKISTSKAIIALLFLTAIVAFAEGQHMPIQMLFGRIKEHRRHRHDENDASQLDQVSSQSQAKSKALTSAINVAGIPITNTVSGTKASSTSEGRSGSINEQFNVGGLGFNAGLDSDKVGTGFVIDRTPGQVGVRLGGLNIGLSNNGGLLGNTQNTQTQTSATSMATGEGATSSSSSNTKSRGFQHGRLFGIQNTLSKSQAQSTSLNGQTSATAAANAASQNTNSFQPNYESQQSPVQGDLEPKEEPSDDQPKISTNRQRRHSRRPHHDGQHKVPPFSPNTYQNFNQYPQNFGFPSQFQQQNSNGNAVAQNQNPFFNQNAGANTHSSNIQNPYGQFQNTGGSSISSNLANNGQSGQLSAANTDQQTYNAADGSGQKNNAQSQSANFDPFGNLQTSNSNTGTQQTFGPNGERQQAFGSSNANEQNKFGSSNSGSQTMAEHFNENGVQGEKSSSSSFSNVVNNGGSNGNFGTNSNSNSEVGNGNAGAGAGAGASGGSFRFKRAADDGVVFPKIEEELDTQNPQQSVNGDVNATESKQNSTQPEDVESRFGLLGGLLSGGGRRQGPLGGLFRGVANGLIQGNQPYYGGAPIGGVPIGGAPYQGQYQPGAYYPQGIGGAYPQPYYPQQAFGR